MHWRQIHPKVGGCSSVLICFLSFMNYALISFHVHEHLIKKSV